MSPNQKLHCLALAGILLFSQLLPGHAQPQPITHVVHISVDGLRPTAITALSKTELPNFYRLREEGAFTDNARCDYDFSVTLPNHTTQVTGRGVLGESGHDWVNNWDPAPGETIASNKASYVASVFDVAHDNGFRTGEYASKSKFVLFATSWDAVSGAPDITGVDNGNNKIDVFEYQPDTAVLVQHLVENMTNCPFGYVFLHLADLDRTGHSYGWDDTPGSVYSSVLIDLDGRLGEMFAMIDSTPLLKGHTAIILTADHGGFGFDHSNPTLAADYTIPFYVWGPGVFPGADLYELNRGDRLNPGAERPSYSEAVQPIRNGEAANLALQLLGLGPVPDSVINFAQDLQLTSIQPMEFRVNWTPNRAIVSFKPAPGMAYDLESTTNLFAGPWTTIFTDISALDGAKTNLEIFQPAIHQGFYRLKLHSNRQP